MNLSTTVNWLSKPKNLWISIFAYTILSGLFVQMILLPYIFPSWQSESMDPVAAKGLLAKMDGQKFHRIAWDVSEAIKAKGWSQWELTPQGQLVSGIAAVCYVLIYPAPWSVLPVNGFLNASAGVCMALILGAILHDKKKGMIAALPFLFFPSNLLWNTQFHNENYAIPGVIFILYGWTILTEKNEEGKYSASLSSSISAIFSITIGSLLLGLVRVYILAGMSYLLILISLGLGAYWFFAKVKAREYASRMTLVVITLILMLSSLAITKPFESKLIVVGNPTASTRTRKPSKWESVVWLPKIIDNQLKALAKYRGKFVAAWEKGGSSIDLDVTFSNTSDMLAYIPRAIQISFLAPFPSMWFSKGRNDSGTAMRIASAFEMILVYFFLLGLPLFFWSHRSQPAVWAISIICAAMLIVYAMIIPNIGSLYRFRYPFLMPLVCFGLAGWMSLFEDRFIFAKRKSA